MLLNDSGDGSATLPLLVAADLQDHLMTASNDLDRLQSLLTHACDTLITSFYGATEKIGAIAGGTSPRDDVLNDVSGDLKNAITALQFQDMASQLIAHTHRRLRNCADRLARDAMGDDDEDGETIVDEMPLRPNPVTQDEMDAGSIDLF